MDEPTAHIDPETDARVQQMVRVEFAQATLITVAHRLHTIADFDRVLVMDAGRTAAARAGMTVVGVGPLPGGTIPPRIVIPDYTALDADFFTVIAR